MSSISWAVLLVNAVTYKVHTRHSSTPLGARRSSVVRAFAHGAMGRRIDPSWGGPIELFLVPATGVTKAVVCAHLSVGWCI